MHRAARQASVNKGIALCSVCVGECGTQEYSSRCRKAVVLVLLAAAAVHGHELACTVPHRLWYSAVQEQPVLLRLPVPKHTQKVLLQKGGRVILEGRMGALQFHGSYQSRIELFNNGTGKIMRCVRDDAGAYEWTAWDLQGNVHCSLNFSLHIEDRAVEAQLQVACQLSGEWRAECSPAGHTYAWFLNSSVLDRSLMYVSQPGDVIILKTHVIGLLTCACFTPGGAYVSNASAVLTACPPRLEQNCVGEEEWRTGHGSPPNTVRKSQLCVDFSIFLLACGAAVVVLMLSVAVYCLKVAAQSKPQNPELLPLGRVVNTKEENKKMEGKEAQEMYTEVHKVAVKEEQSAGSQMETFLQTFSRD